MIAHTSGFKNTIINLGRELYVKINYYNVVYNLITEDDKLIITQDNLELLTEEMESLTPDGELTNEDIVMLKKNNLGELFRTYMKSFDLETPHRFNVGDKMIVQIGTKVNDDIEYLNYGIYYVYQRTYNEDTQTYTYTICDRMIFTMVPYDNEIAYDTYNGKSCYALIIDMLKRLCGFDNSNITLNTGMMANYVKIIYKNTFEGLEMTCRDVLDMIMQANGSSLVIEYDEQTKKDYITTKNISNTIVETINEDILSNSNIKVIEKFGKINSLLFKRAGGLDNLEKKDQASIDANGLCQYAIENNLVLDQENREDFLDNLYNAIKDIQYYTCDIETIGLGYIEYLDMFKIQTPDNQYNCLCLKNTMEIKSGMSETFTTEAPIEKTKKYESGALSDKDAKILVDKLKGEIVLKTDSDGKLAQVRLDSSGDEGSLVEIVADNIKLEGYTTINDGFSIDQDGNMTCVDATMEDVNINGGKITMNDTGETGHSPSITINKANNDTKLEIFSDYINITKKNASGYFYGILSGITPDRIYTINNDDYSNYSYFEANKERAGFTSTPTDPDGWWCYMDRFGTIGARNYTNLSLEEKKKDFEELDNALNIIKDIDIYKYRYKEEEDTKKHIGLVIGDKYNYSKEITNDKNDGVDLYSFISVCCKAIQEQQEQIEELKKEIETLKGGNK